MLLGVPCTSPSSEVKCLPHWTVTRKQPSEMCESFVSYKALLKCFWKVTGIYPHFLPQGTVKELKVAPSSYVFFPQAQLQGLFSGSHNDWLTPVFEVGCWVTVAVSLGTLQRYRVISMAAVVRKARSRRSWCNLVLPHAALVMVIVGQLGLPHILLLMLHFWVLLVHQVNNPLPSLSPLSTLGSLPAPFPPLSSDKGIKFLSQHPTQLQLLPNQAETSFLPSNTIYLLQENIPDLCSALGLFLHPYYMCFLCRP